MKVEKAAELLLSSKSKRKGIDKETKTLIKELEKVGMLDPDMLKNPYHLARNARSILLMKDNDFFNPKEIAIAFLKESENLADSWLEYSELLETIIYPDDNEWTGGLNDKEWAYNLIDYALNNLSLEGADIKQIAFFVSEYANDKDKAHDLLKLAGPKAENMAQAVDIANELIDSYEDYDSAKQLILDSIERELEYLDDDDLNYLNEKLLADINQGK